MKTDGASVAWLSVWQPGRFDRQFGPSFATSQHSCPLLHSSSHCSDIWGKAVFNNKPFQGKGWYFCYFVLLGSQKWPAWWKQWHGTDDSDWPSMPLIVVHLAHKCGLKNSSPMVPLDSRRNSRVCGSVNTWGKSVTCICPWGARSIQLKKFWFQHWLGSQWGKKAPTYCFFMWEQPPSKIGNIFLLYDYMLSYFNKDVAQQQILTVSVGISTGEHLTRMQQPTNKNLFRQFRTQCRSSLVLFLSDDLIQDLKYKDTQDKEIAPRLVRYAESIKSAFLHSRVFIPWETHGSSTKYVLWQQEKRVLVNSCMIKQRHLLVKIRNWKNTKT